MIVIFLRDIRLAFRSGGGFGLALVFFLILCILFPLALGPDQKVLSKFAPGVLWVGALLACLLSLDRIFATDVEDGSVDLLASAPIPLASVYLAKSAAHWAVTGLPLALLAPFFGVMLGFPSHANGVLVLSLLIGTPALSLIGAFGAALTISVKRGGLLLSLLILPLYVPSLIFAAEATRRAADMGAVEVPLLMLAGITLGCAAILPFASAAVLRMNLR